MLEGWDMKTLKMPEYLIKLQMAEMENGVMPSVCALPAAPSRRLLATNH